MALFNNYACLRCGKVELYAKPKTYCEFCGNVLVKIPNDTHNILRGKELEKIREEFPEEKRDPELWEKREDVEAFSMSKGGSFCVSLALMTLMCFPSRSKR